ncbi:MAG: hypothetical protein DRJ01_13750 [Bacteroidetes bacterium]|nr:MAG: hypothetical protein DRJ01_13750 [Bacteroidota bacterium]
MPMKEQPKYIEAPKIQADLLWKMTPEEFNNWRKINDYPRIVGFLKEKLPRFIDWMNNQNITDEMLIEHSPSNFLRERKVIYLYTVLNNNSEEQQILHFNDYNTDESISYEQTKLLVKQKRKLIPYPDWFKKEGTDKILNLSITSSIGRKNYFMGELGLIDLGNYKLPFNYSLRKRNLDFVTLDDLKINYARNNTILKIWFSSAVNLSVEGDLAFIDAYNTSFYGVRNSIYSSLKLNNGVFQNWSFSNCELRLNATYANLFRWKVVGYDFKASLNLCDIRESYFSIGKIKYDIDFGRGKDFHAHIKRLYSQLGRRKEASTHYFLERKYERKSFLKVKSNYWYEYQAIKKNKFFKVSIFYIKSYSRYFISSLLNILWGYGEKPWRVFILSTITILFFALIFCYCPGSSLDTKGDILNSLYFSLVTFTTIGSGDIEQTDYALKLISGIEALLGLSFWGILIAGFANNSKDY